ncbi:MAG TPA: tetratricopeptide repeat protein [Bryobacteraceae bacterium]|nr:tetratricopeptide repeat protein [Bryobacteraceae bacterium]
MQILLASVLAVYELVGHIDPSAKAAISLYGATTPFTGSAVSDGAGRFRFRKLQPGSYTLAVFIAGRGEVRRTVEVGPGTADAHGRVNLTLSLRDSDFVFGEVRRAGEVSARVLQIPERATREYEEAQKELGRRDAEAAAVHLEKAVSIAPHFAAAWNNLGTIAYQTRKFERAEECFRQALAQDPKSYEALVNLGGVLVTLNKAAEAEAYNQRAVSVRPNDALANSQLGMVYFEMERWKDAEKYLSRACEIDPAHFSHPQLMLAEVYVREGRPGLAAEVLEEFLRYHPDWADAARLRERIARLR